MQYLGRTPGVAKIFERDEFLAEAFSGREVTSDAGLVNQPARGWRDAAGAGRKAGQPPVAHMDHCWSLANPADDAGLIDAPEKCFEILVFAWIFTDDGVFYRDAEPLIDQPRNDVETRLLISTKVVEILQIEYERDSGPVRDLAQSPFEPDRVAGIGTGQHHRTGEGVTAQDRRLVDCPAIRWPKARYCPKITGKSGQPFEKLFVLSERDVIEEGVPAIKKARQTTSDEMVDDLLILDKIE